jgi:ketosteroid isomerase-like protein
MRLLKLILLSCTAFYCNHSFAQQTDLHQTIARLDSTFFHAYNTCDIPTQAAFYADTIEFFHDRSGLDTSKQRILENTKKYICGKVTRTLVPGSIEVSPLPGYGAVELGMHSFYNNQEPNAPSRPSRFMIIWRKTGEQWKITKVISLH